MSAPITYTDAQKREVIDYVNAYNAEHGKGGQREAATHFNVSQLTIAGWMKKHQTSAVAPTGTRLNHDTGLVELTDEQPRDPAWDAVRETSAQLKTVGRMFLRVQVRLGMLLAALKKEHCKHGGDRKKQVPNSGTWSEIVKRETGYSRQSGENFIHLYEQVLVKLKKSKKLELPPEVKKNALALFQDTSALVLTPEQWMTVDGVIGTLTTGETQTSLMQEIGIVPTPPKMPKGGKQQEEEESGEEESAGQLAFIFFGTVASPMVNARTNPEYRKLLLALPVHGDAEHPLSLSSLAAEARAFLADLEETIEATAKPARGRTIETPIDADPS